MRYLWCGTEIERLSREELVAALKQMIDSQEASHKRSMQVFESWRMCLEARKARP